MEHAAGLVGTRSDVEQSLRLKNPKVAMPTSLLRAHAKSKSVRDSIIAAEAPSGDADVRQRNPMIASGVRYSLRIPGPTNYRKAKSP